MVAVAVPKAAASARARRVQLRRHGRRSARSTTAPTTRRNQATVVEGMSENRETARPAPRYWEKAEATKTSGAGTLPATALPAPPAPVLLLRPRGG